MRRPQKHAKKKLKDMLKDMLHLTDLLRNPCKRIPHASMRYSFLQQSFLGGEKEKYKRIHLCDFPLIIYLCEKKTRRQDILYFVYLPRFFLRREKGTNKDTFVWIMADFVIGARLH